MLESNMCSCQGGDAPLGQPLAELQKREKMSYEECDRYMDDMREVLLALKVRQRWEVDGFY